MNSSDTASYNKIAEIHVPDMCTAGFGDGFTKGCVFPGAENFDPLAKEVGDCHYLTQGCTIEGSLNYNAEATLNDGSCIAEKKGCTVGPGGYDGVDSDTPEYKDRWYGSALRHVGIVDWVDYKEMTNYDST